jgi:hypothetical protein
MLLGGVKSFQNEDVKTWALNNSFFSSSTLSKEKWATLRMMMMITKITPEV